VLAVAAGACVVGFAEQASAKPAIVQDNWGQQDGLGHATCKWAKNIVANDLLIATVTYTGGSGTTITPAAAAGGIAGQTWTEITSSADTTTNIGVRMYYVTGVAANATKPTETWTVSPSTAEVVLEFHEFGGVQISGALDAAARTQSVIAGTSATISATTAQTSSEMTFVVMAAQNGTSNLGVPKNASNVNYSAITSVGTTNTQTPSTTNTRTRSSYILVTSASSTSVSATATLASANWAAAIATFQLTEIHWIGNLPAGSYPPRTMMDSVCHGFFDDDGCWSSTSGGPNNVASPANTDVVVFDGGGTGDVTFNPFVAGTESAYSIEVKSTYTGNLSVTDRVGDIPDLSTVGPLLLEGATFNLNAAQLQVGTTTTMNGSTAVFSGASGTEAFLGAVTLTAGTMTIGPSPTFGGAVQIGTALSSSTTGSLTLSSGNVTLPSLTIDGTGSLFNAGTTNLTVTAGTTIDFGGSFNAGPSGTKTFTGQLVMGTTAGLTNGTFTLNAATASFNSANAVVLRGGSVFTATTAGGMLTFGTSVVATKDAITLTNGTMNLSGATTTIAGSGNLTITAGTFTAGGALSLPANLADNGTFDAGASTAITINGNLSGSGIFHSKNATIDVKGTTTMTGAASFDSTASAFNMVTFESTITTSGTGTLDLSNTTPTISSGVVTIGGGTTLLLGAQPLTFPSDVAVAGTFTSGSGALTFQGAVTNSAGTLNLTNPTSLTFSSSLFKVNGGATTFGSQAVTIPAAVQVTGGSMSLGSGTSALQSTLTVSGGAFNGGAGPLTVTNLVSLSGGAITSGSVATTFQNALAISGGTFNGSLTASASLTVAGAAQIEASGGVNNTTFNANAGRMTFNGTTTVCYCTATAKTSTFNSGTSTLLFNGQVVIGGSDGTRGLFHAQGANITFAFPTTAMATDSVVLQGAANTVFDTNAAAPFPTITFGQNAIAGTNALDMLTGTVTFSAAANAGSTTAIFNPTTPTVGAGNVVVGAGTTLTFSNSAAANGATFPQSVTVAGTLTGGAGALVFAGPVGVSGTFSGGTGARTFSNTLSVSGAYTSSSGLQTFSNTVTNSAGTMDLHTASSLTFNMGSSLVVSGGVTTFFGSAVATHVPILTVSAGTFDAASHNTNLVIDGTTTVSGGTANMASTRNITLTGDVAVSGAGIVTLGSAGESLGGKLTVSGGSFTAGSGAVTIFGAVSVSGGTVTMGGGVEALQSTLDVPGGTFTAGAGPVTVTGLTTATASGIINGGACTNLTFSNGVTLGTMAAGSVGTFNGNTAVVHFSSTMAVQGGSTFNANASTVTFTGAFSLLGSSFFNGNTGSGTFAATPVLTSGTFTVGDAGTAGTWTFSLAAGTMTFASGTTLAFPTSGGELSFKNGNNLSIDGTVTSSSGAITASTPKIDCKGCVGGAGFTVTFTGHAVLNVNGLNFDHVSSAGVQIQDNVTYTSFRNVKFSNNAANGTASGTHLSITSSNPGGSTIIKTSGCYFDSTAKYNVTLNGVMGSTGIRFLFEDLNAATNGPRAGYLWDLDGDTNFDNIADGTDAAHNYGAVVEWVGANAIDTTGVAAGYPSAAFDWNTFQWYGIYVAYNNVSGGGDLLWVRNNDGASNYSSYSFAVPSGDGTIVGTPWWDTVNETVAGTDVNGNGNQTDTDVHVVYVATSGGHIFRLIDNGTTLTQPTAGVWSVAGGFTSTHIATITSPLIEDGTNLYFGGTDASSGSTTDMYAVQIAGTNDGTLQREVLSVGAVTTTPSSAVVSGSTYVYLGSSASGGHAYVYRVNMSAGTVDSSVDVTTTVNDSVRLESDNYAYAVTAGGTMHVLDALNFTMSGSFADIAHFPYTAAGAIERAPYVDYQTNIAYFGDDGGKLNAVVTSTGANLNAGYPFSLGAIQVTSSPVYLSGVIAVGASDGNLYFVDRNSGGAVPNVFRRYFVTGGGSVSSVAYDYNTSQYMVSSSDGKLVFINGADVTDPTMGTQ
jgi:fibronectin-binding autotransporter adhesin